MLSPVYFHAQYIHTSYKSDKTCMKTRRAVFLLMPPVRVHTSPAQLCPISAGWSSLHPLTFSSFGNQLLVARKQIFDSTWNQECIIAVSQRVMHLIWHSPRVV